MKKRLVIIGIIAILISIELSGCSNIGITNIGDIQANPEKYLNKEVTVEGSCALYAIYDNNQHFIMYQYPTLLSGKYRLTGVYRGNSTLLGYYLDVTKVEAI